MIFIVFESCKILKLNIFYLKIIFANQFHLIIYKEYYINWGSGSNNRLLNYFTGQSMGVGGSELPLNAYGQGPIPPVENDFKRYMIRALNYIKPSEKSLKINWIKNLLINSINVLRNDSEDNAKVARGGRNLKL